MYGPQEQPKYDIGFDKKKKKRKKNTRLALSVTYTIACNILRFLT